MDTEWIANLNSQINRLSAPAYRTARYLHDLRDPATGCTTLDWETALLRLQIGAGTLRNHLYFLQRAGVISYSTNGNVCVSFTLHAERETTLRFPAGRETTPKVHAQRETVHAQRENLHAEREATLRFPAGRETTSIFHAQREDFHAQREKSTPDQSSIQSTHLFDPDGKDDFAAIESAFQRIAGRLPSSAEAHMLAWARRDGLAEPLIVLFEQYYETLRNKNETAGYLRKTIFSLKNG